MQNKSAYIHSLFSRIASRYDLINDIMTASLHRKWKKRLLDELKPDTTKAGNLRVLDLCTGTGDIAELWIHKPFVSEVIGVDSCASMLQTGYDKIKRKFNGKPPKLTMIQADALELPFPDNHFDCVSVGFGLRNTSDPDQALREIYRVLKPGGYFGSLDLGHPRIPVINWFYKNIFLRLIPTLGLSLANDKAAYQYLVDSLRSWPPQQQLSQALYNFGFTRSYYEDIMLGAVAIIIAQK